MRTIFITYHQFLRCHLITGMYQGCDMRRRTHTISKPTWSLSHASIQERVAAYAYLCIDSTLENGESKNRKMKLFNSRRPDSSALSPAASLERSDMKALDVGSGDVIAKSGYLRCKLLSTSAKTLIREIEHRLFSACILRLTWFDAPCISYLIDNLEYTYIKYVFVGDGDLQ